MITTVSESKELVKTETPAETQDPFFLTLKREDQIGLAKLGFKAKVLPGKLPRPHGKTYNQYDGGEGRWEKLAGRYVVLVLDDSPNGGQTMREARSFIPEDAIVEELYLSDLPGWDELYRGRDFDSKHDGDIFQSKLSVLTWLDLNRMRKPEKINQDVLRAIEFIEDGDDEDSNAETWLDADELERPEAMIPGLLSEADLFYLAGPSKIGKSWLATQLALCAAAGRPFLQWSIPRPLNVVVLQYEVPGGVWRERARDMAKALGITKADIGDRLDVRHVRDMPARARPYGLNKINRPIDLLVIDPLYCYFNQYGWKDTQEGDVSEFLGQTRAWQQLSDAAICIVHHTHRPRTNAGLALNPLDLLGGSTLLGRDLDGLLSILPHSDAIDDLGDLEAAADADKRLTINHVSRHEAVAPFALDWTYPVFTASEAEAKVRRPLRGRKEREKKVAPEAIAEMALAWLEEQSPVFSVDMQERIAEHFDIKETRVKQGMALLRKRPEVESWTQKKKGGKAIVGLTAHKGEEPPAKVDN